MFKTGQKIVCISDWITTHPFWDGPHFVKGVIYTYDGDCIKCANCGHGFLSEFGKDHVYAMKNFRPLIEDDSYAEEALKKIKILQLEHEREGLKEFIKLEEV